ncbi:MAG: CDP-alcohol phosphatidyltransferase family protein [Anaerotignaceae bacterium]
MIIKNKLNIPNIVTASRILLSFTLLFVEPQSIMFFAIYAICGTTDILDGYMARKTKTASNLGATLDSLADLIFIFIMLIIYLPILNIPPWCTVCIVVISIIRLSSLLI